MSDDMDDVLADVIDSLAESEDDDKKHKKHGRHEDDSE